MNTRNSMRSLHPGEVLRDEIEALDLSANALSKAQGEFWMNLQKTWELRQAEIAAGREIANCVTPRQVATTRAACDARP